MTAKWVKNQRLRQQRSRNIKRKSRDIERRGTPKMSPSFAKQHGFRMEPVTDHPCPCGATCEPTNGARIHPHRPDLADHRFYLCMSCGRRCGTHRGSWEPLGVPATIIERQLRQNAHWRLDSMWTSQREGERCRMRAELYKWLARKMELTPEETHIGRMDEPTLRRCIAVLDAEIARLAGPARDR